MFNPVRQIWWARAINMHVSFMPICPASSPLAGNIALVCLQNGISQPGLMTRIKHHISDGFHIFPFFACSINNICVMCFHSFPCFFHVCLRFPMFFSTVSLRFPYFFPTFSPHFPQKNMGAIAPGGRRRLCRGCLGGLDGRRCGALLHGGCAGAENLSPIRWWSSPVMFVGLSQLVGGLE